MTNYLYTISSLLIFFIYISVKFKITLGRKTQVITKFTWGASTSERRKPMKKADFTTYVPKDLVLNPNTTGLDILTYILLNMYGSNYFNDPLYITPSFVLGHIKEGVNYDKIRQSFNYISDLYPDFLSETEMRSTYKLDIHGLDIKTFVKVPYYELQVILESDYSYKINLIKMYYVIIGSFISEICGFKGTNYGFGWFSDVMGTANKTISSYITCLNKLELIYVYQDKNRKTNIMCRYYDQQKIREWAKEHGYTGGSRSSSNEARSLMMKYHQIEKGKGTRYSPSEISQIKSYIKWYNETHEDKKDMSVFDTINN